MATGYRTPDFAPEYAVVIVDDDRQLISTTTVTTDRTAACEQLERLQRGYRLSRLEWRPDPESEWFECSDDDLTRAAFRQACAAADGLAAAEVPFVNWSIYTSGPEAHLDVVVHTPDARRILGAYAAFFETEIVPEAKHLSLTAVYQGVQVRMQCRAEQEVAA